MLDADAARLIIPADTKSNTGDIYWEASQHQHLNNKQVIKRDRSRYSGCCSHAFPLLRGDPPAAHDAVLMLSSGDCTNYRKHSLKKGPRPMKNDNVVVVTVYICLLDARAVVGPLV